jgi:hypothetical protein
MLASTMQFSNNDPSPNSTHYQQDSSSPVHNREHFRALRTQQRARPDQLTMCVPRRSSTNTHNQPCRIVNVPPMS